LVVPWTRGVRRFCIAAVILARCSGVSGTPFGGTRSLRHVHGLDSEKLVLHAEGFDVADEMTPADLLDADESLAFKYIDGRTQVRLLTVDRRRDFGLRLPSCCST
jgi:hypothetical protein